MTTVRILAHVIALYVIWRVAAADGSDWGKTMLGMLLAMRAFELGWDVDRWSKEKPGDSK